MKFDCIIIGSGISGLTAGSLLARKGKKVLLLEKNKRIGGCLRRFKRNNIPFDIGFHYTGCLGEGEILHLLWKYLHILNRLHILKFPEEGCDLVKIKDTDCQINGYFSAGLLRDELRQKFPSEKTAIDTYYSTITEICKKNPFYNTELSLADFLRPGYFPIREKLEDFLLSITSDTRLLAFLGAPSFLYGVCPSEASLFAHASIAFPLLSGAYSIDGGGQAIADAYKGILDENGVIMKGGHEVTGIELQNGKVSGVCTAESRFETSDVIYTGHPAYLLDLVPKDAFRPAYRSRIRDLKDSKSMFVVFAELQGDISYFTDLKWKNYFSIPAGIKVLSVDQNTPESGAILLTAPGLRDTHQNLSERGCGVILMRPAEWEETAAFSASRQGARPPNYGEGKEKAAKRLIEEAKGRFQLHADLKPLAIGTPLTFRDELTSAHGAAYGIQHRADQLNPNARTRIAGLWLSGQSTLMPGIVGAALSGFVTAGEMLGLDALWREVRRCP